MLDELREQLTILVSLAGAFVAAFMGSAARNVYHPEGFRLRNLLWDVPFVFLCALLAGGAGELMNLPAVVTWAMSGAFGYLGGQFLGPLLQRFFEKRAGLEEDDERSEKDA